jgi:hypothetical protein
MARRCVRLDNVTGNFGLVTNYRVVVESVARAVVTAARVVVNKLGQIDVLYALSI